MDSADRDADPNMMTSEMFPDLMKMANPLFYAAFGSSRHFISTCEESILLTTNGWHYLDRGGCRPLSA